MAVEGIGMVVVPSHPAGGEEAGIVEEGVVMVGDDGDSVLVVLYGTMRITTMEVIEPS